MSRDIDDIDIQSQQGDSEFQNMNIYGKLNYRFNNDDITMKTLNATGGITGNVTGNLTGTADKAINATTAEGLTDIASIDTTGNITANKFFGDGSNLTGIVGVPSGCIILWSGAANAIPSGFVLCNGQNSTPDLRNRFVVGAYSDSANAAWPNLAPGDTGGSADAIVVTHTHGDGSYATNTATLTGQIRGISESFAGFGGSASGVFTKFGGATLGGTPGSPDSNACGGVNFNGDHSHNVSGTSGSTGSSGDDANLPPYYSLCYIMKT